VANSIIIAIYINLYNIIIKVIFIKKSKNSILNIKKRLINFYNSLFIAKYININKAEFYKLYN
jgi:hypothetical protein